MNLSIDDANNIVHTNRTARYSTLCDHAVCGKESTGITTVMVVII
jgi:hypothetical protein